MCKLYRIIDIISLLKVKRLVQKKINENKNLAAKIFLVDLHFFEALIISGKIMVHYFDDVF